MWNFKIETDRIFEAAKQDIIFVEVKKKNLIDVAVSGDHNIKVKKMTDLRSTLNWSCQNLGRSGHYCPSYH